MTYLLRLLALLLLFLELNVEGEADEGDPDPNADASDGDAETTLDDFLDDRERDLGGRPAPKGDEEESPAEKRAREAQERADAADRRASDAERRAREAEQRATPTSQRDPEYEREEAELAAARAKGEDVTWLQWRINKDRNERSLRREVSQERMLSADERDRAQFERIESTHPKLYAKYKDRVEQWRAESSKGGVAPAPRAAILRLLLGDDMINGKLKVKTRARQTESVERVRVDRGGAPLPRSDVSGKTRKTESEARRERLRNMPI